MIPISLSKVVHGERKLTGGRWNQEVDIPEPIDIMSAITVHVLEIHL